MSLSGKDFTMPSPFTNPTKYQVGQIRKVDTEQMVVSAIVRITDNQFQIYGVPFNNNLKLKEFTDYQKRRESGQIKVYIPGRLISLCKIAER